jgi:hypothetical protein
LRGQTHLDARQRQPDRAGPTLAVDRIRYEHHRLGHAITLEDPLSGRLLESRVLIRGQRRRTRHAQTQRAQCAGIPELEQPVVHRGHAEEERGLGAQDRARDGVGVEARHEHRRCARVQRAVQPDAETVHVEERQREHEPVVRAPAPRDPQRFRAREQVRMREHSAFGPARRARGVADQRGSFGRRGVERRWVRVGQCERGGIGGKVRVGRAQRVGPRGVVADRGARLGIADDVRELGRAIGGVRGHDHEPEPHARDVRHDQIERSHSRHQHAIAGAQPGRVQPPCSAAGRGVERAIAERAAALVGERGSGCRAREVARPAARQRARTPRRRVEGGPHSSGTTPKWSQ